MVKASRVVEERGAGGIRGDEPGQFAARLGGDIEERAERPGGRQRVAGADEDAGRIARPVAEMVDEGRLADPGFASEENEAPLGGRGPPEEGLQGVDLGGALEQVHGRYDRPPAGSVN